MPMCGRGSSVYKVRALLQWDLETRGTGVLYSQTPYVSAYAPTSLSLSLFVPVSISMCVRSLYRDRRSARSVSPPLPRSAQFPAK